MSIEYTAEGPRAVQSVDFDYGMLDTIEDIAREALENGYPLRDILREQLKNNEHELRMEGFRMALTEIIGRKRPDLRAWSLAFACGLDLTLGLSGPQIAKHLGISKQSFMQTVESVRLEFQNGISNPNQRSEEARETMRKRNYRK